MCRIAPYGKKKLQPVNTAAQREEHNYRLSLITAYDVVSVTSRKNKRLENQWQAQDLEENKLVKRLLYNVNRTNYPGVTSQMTEIEQESLN